MTEDQYVAERITLRAQRRRQAEQLAKAEAKRHAEARERAKEIWERAGEANSSHPYLVKKAVRAHGLRQSRDRLIIPVCDLYGVLHGPSSSSVRMAKKYS